MKQVNVRSTRTVYQNKWMRIREDEFEADGVNGIYGVVEKLDFAVILPLLKDSVVFVEQFRYATNETSLELPQGSWETQASANMFDVAHAELEDETGWRAKTLINIGKLCVAPGYSNQRVHVFLATDLQVGKQHLEKTEEGLVVREIPIDNVFNSISNQDVTDAATVNALFLAIPYVQKLQLAFEKTFSKR